MKFKVNIVDKVRNLDDSIPIAPTFSLSLSLYIYIYIYVCVCVCVCVCFGSISSLIHISLNNEDSFCLRILVSVLSGCCIDFMVSGWNWLMNPPPVTNLFPSTFCLILGHHQGCIYCKSDMTLACA